ncbi:hypothetical protein MN0502_21940 [Arthrobacter sp. MN05-02]|nr:hypothetical protein MN0502_21940 [Arthrobacter sp. MN05-02]
MIRAADLCRYSLTFVIDRRPAEAAFQYAFALVIELRAAVMLIASVSATVFPDSCTVTRVTLKSPLRGAIAAVPALPSRPKGDADFIGVTGCAKCSPYRAFEFGSSSGFHERSGTKDVTSSCAAGASAVAADAGAGTVGCGVGAVFVPLSTAGAGATGAAVAFGAAGALAGPVGT